MYFLAGKVAVIVTPDPSPVPAAAAAAFSTISWFEAAAARSDNVCDAELLVRRKDPKTEDIQKSDLSGDAHSSDPK